jgi:hypothetical protein
MINAIRRAVKANKLNEATSKSKSGVIAHTVKNIQNPPKIMQHRSKRDREREEQLKYRDIAKRESVSPDILPKSGAGQLGTDELRKTYQKDTPGQNITRFKDYKLHK